MQARGSIRRVAHDPGDPQITSHCPFCGSGQIVGRSDGTIECDFCGMNYIVRVQPAFPGSPQGPGMMGAPTDVGPEMGPGGEGLMGPDELGPDGEPMDDGGFPPDAEDSEDGGFPPDDEGEDGGGFPPDEEDSEGSDDNEGPPEKKSKGKDKGSKKESSFRTLTGAALPEGAYVRHLAVLHSGGSPRVLAQLRSEAASRCEGTGSSWKSGPGARPVCPSCGRGPGSMGASSPRASRKGYLGTVPEHDDLRHQGGTGQASR